MSRLGETVLHLEIHILKEIVSPAEAELEGTTFSKLEFCVGRNVRNKSQTTAQPLYLSCSGSAAVDCQPAQLLAAGSSLCWCVCLWFYRADSHKPPKHFKRYGITLVLFVPEEDCEAALESSRYFWYAVLEFFRHNSEGGNCFMGYLANPDMFI